MRRSFKCIRKPLDNIFSASIGWLLLSWQNVKQTKKQTNKQTNKCFIIKCKKKSRGYFHPEMKYLHQKCCSNYADIPSSRSRILASWEEMKNISALYKRNSKFIKKWLSSFDIVYCLVPLVILCRLLFKQFLTEDGWS